MKTNLTITIRQGGLGGYAFFDTFQQTVGHNPGAGGLRLRHSHRRGYRALFAYLSGRPWSTTCAHLLPAEGGWLKCDNPTHTHAIDRAPQPSRRMWFEFVSSIAPVATFWLCLTPGLLLLMLLACEACVWSKNIVSFRGAPGSALRPPVSHRQRYMARTGESEQ